MTNRLLKIVLLAALAYFEAFPQSFPFTTYTTTDGLAQSAVSCFFQDSRGHMWFGTWGGISRYDGRTFWSYRNSAFHVTSICEDGRDTLWIGTTSGLARLAFGDSTVRWVKTRDGSLPSDYVLTLLKDDDGNMWVGTDRGLVVYTPSGRSVSFGTEQGLQDQYIPVLRKDSTGAILIGSGRGHPAMCDEERRTHQCAGAPQRHLRCPDDRTAQWRHSRGFVSRSKRHPIP